MALFRDVSARTDLKFDRGTQGTIKFFRHQHSLADALSTIDRLQRKGVVVETLAAAGVVEREPALAGIASEIVGGIYSPADEIADCYQFTLALEGACRRDGVSFVYDCEAVDLVPSAGRKRIESVCVRSLSASEYGFLSARSFVVAAGCWSPSLTQSLGIALRVYPVKGYSVTVEALPSQGPRLAITDADAHCVYTKLGNRFRVAGLVEVDNWSLAINRSRCDALLHTMRQIFPAASDYRTAKCWAGLRPVTPSGIPYVRQASVENLYLNTGHGGLGWTLCLASGSDVADLIQGIG
jgi:D-amino-acid dehydrogenase